MPYSAGENTEYVKDILTRLNPKTVIDIGPGSGTYGRIVNETISAETMCVEIFSNYVTEFNLNDIYSHVVVADARNYHDYRADLVIAGDVLEHMSSYDMKFLVDKILREAKWLIISIPIIHYPQGHSHGNEHEAHVQDDLNTSRLIGILGEPEEYVEYDITGTYLYKGI